MKTFNRTILALATVLALASCATAQLTTEEKINIENAIRTNISEKNFKMQITMMNPARGRARHVNNFSVEIKDDVITSNLPYYGVAYSAPYGGGHGLNFTSKIQSYETSEGKNSSTKIVIGIRNDEDNYTYRFEIFPNGTAYLSVTATNRDSISYTGNIVLDN